MKSCRGFLYFEVGEAEIERAEQRLEKYREASLELLGQALE